uniref:Uncharacterized protein n=1 Tax=Rhizophora mucronata TaxID=61149 RepID=A0A2P2PXX7_RHIMU
MQRKKLKSLKFTI